jgi:hypothetical protein
MTDPLTTALGVYKGVALAKKAKGVLDKFARKNTDRFIAERDEMHRQWSAETHRRVADHIEDSREEFLQMGGTLDEHERLLNELFDQHGTHLLAALYADDAYREVVTERRRMLSFAAASIVALDLTIEEKARVEKVLRDLYPADVLELHKLSRAVGCIRRMPGGGQQYHSTDALRYALLSNSGSDDALSSARCVRETIVPSGSGWGGAGGTAFDVAFVTDRGDLVVRVLRKYIDEKHDAFVGCGREEIPGSRSEVEARKVLAATPGFLPVVRAALRKARATDRWLRAHFEHARPTLAQGDARQIRELTEPSPAQPSTLMLPALPPDLAHAIPAPDGHEISVALQDLPAYGRPAINVVITGPFDVLRWLADDLDAWWR